MRRERDAFCTALGLAVVGLILWPGAALAGDGAVALKSADPPCSDDSSNIYVDCGNGTVTDNRTGLVWLKDAGCLGISFSWYEAMEAAAALADLPAELDLNCAPFTCDCGLSDGSSPGEWRLPSIAEWQTMTADAVGLGCTGATWGPAITSDDGIFCWATSLCDLGIISCSFERIQKEHYWSASPLAVRPAGNESGEYSFEIDLFDGTTDSYSRRPGVVLYVPEVWPVRGGQ